MGSNVKVLIFQGQEQNIEAQGIALGFMEAVGCDNLSGAELQQDYHMLVAWNSEDTAIKKIMEDKSTTEQSLLFYTLDETMKECLDEEEYVPDAVPGFTSVIYSAKKHIKELNLDVQIDVYGSVQELGFDVPPELFGNLLGSGFEVDIDTTRELNEGLDNSEMGMMAFRLPKDRFLN